MKTRALRLFGRDGGGLRLAAPCRRAGATPAVPITGTAEPGLESFDTTVESMMKRYLYPTGNGSVLGVQGGFPGTRSILQLVGENGWALLVNTAPPQPSFDNVLYSALSPVVKKIGSWPDVDLFSQFP